MTSKGKIKYEYMYDPVPSVRIVKTNIMVLRDKILLLALAATELLAQIDQVIVDTEAGKTDDPFD